MPLKVVATADTTTFLVNTNLNLSSPMYTMYIAGQSPTIDTLFREEKNYPFIRQDRTPPSSDSVVNLRFVNLSPNSTPVKIKIAGATTNEVDNLPYKGITDFKAYVAKLTPTSYAFQVRDAVTDALLVSYTFSATSTNRFTHVALIFKGLVGGTGANVLSISAINYF